ncbi:MAG: pseudouridine synthase [Acholeplasmataceae bacterium]|nr:pseudouridine synthase [Acholeplasmataceae bacterium]
MRIDKLLSQLKYCTRSEAKTFLEQHVFTINNKRVQSSHQSIDPTCDIMVLDGKKVFYKSPIHLMINKPKGYLSANHDPIHPCVVDLIKDPYDRFDYSIAGRLDIDTEGLIILTTDGSFVHDIISPKKHVQKVYEVILDKTFTHDKELLLGVTIKDGKNQEYLAKAIELTKNEEKIYLTIDEGKFHQVKRMFQALNYQVTHLKRIQIGKLKLGDLSPGDYIEITKEMLYD